MGLQDAIKLPPVKVTTLPTASAETAGKIYYVGPTDGEYERYITSAVEGSYDWIDLGGTSIPLPSIADNLTTDDATQALSAKQGKVLDGKISQLRHNIEAKVEGNLMSSRAKNALLAVFDKEFREICLVDCAIKHGEFGLVSILIKFRLHLRGHACLYLG
jgi:hypothetical protein